MSKIRLGFLGVGPRGSQLVDCYSMHNDVEFVAFADIAENRSAQVADAYNRDHGGDDGPRRRRECPPEGVRRRPVRGNDGI